MGWITDTNGCDIWQGSRNNYGYGRVMLAERKIRYIHRVRYEREIGPIPAGMDLDHFVCDNGAGGCCNPFHCRPATRRENLLRGNTITAACAAKTHCPKGHLLAGENLIRNRLPGRSCRICCNVRQNAVRAAKKALQP